MNHRTIKKESVGGTSATLVGTAHRRASAVKREGS